MPLYRFSPITSKDALVQAVIYTAEKTSELCQKIVGEAFPISSLTIFSHYPSEYEALVTILSGMGTPKNENNGPRVRLHEPLAAGKNTLTHLRIRKPDPYRMQVGCNDFEVADYENFKQQYLMKNPNSLRIIERSEYEMIEFFDPDYDVLAYAVSR